MPNCKYVHCTCILSSTSMHADSPIYMYSHRYISIHTLDITVITEIRPPIVSVIIKYYFMSALICISISAGKLCTFADTKDTIS